MTVSGQVARVSLTARWRKKLLSLLATYFIYFYRLCRRGQILFPRRKLIPACYASFLLNIRSRVSILFYNNGNKANKQKKKQTCSVISDVKLRTQIPPIKLKQTSSFCVFILTCEWKDNFILFTTFRLKVNEA